MQWRDLYDPIEVFHDRNDRDICIEIEVDANPADYGSQDYVRCIRFQCARASPNYWRITSILGDGKSGLHSGNLVIEGDTIVRGDVRITTVPILTAISTLANSLYIGPFRNPINDGAADYYSLHTGTAFINTWHEWKTGGVKQQNARLAQVTEDIRRLFKFEQLEINASPGLKTLSLSVNNHPYKLRELGAGISQFILVLGNAAIRRPALLLIDEPEMGLHPPLQIDFLTSLAFHASFGIVFSTHSLGLARSTAERIYAVRKVLDASLVSTVEKTPNYLELMGELSYSSFVETGACCILAVEGVTEVKTVQQWLRKIKKDKDIVVFPLGGSQLINANTAYELSELKRLNTNISILIDSEKPNATDSLMQHREAFVQNCKKLELAVHVTNLRATENYFPDRAIKAVKGTKYRQLEPYEKLDECKPSWSKAENWLIALEMTEAELDATDVGKFLRSIGPVEQTRGQV